MELPNLRFASSDSLRSLLRVEPGCVTPLAVVNDPLKKVSVVLDSQLLKFKRLYCHPLVNTASVSLPPDALDTFYQFTGHVPLVHDFVTC